MSPVLHRCTGSLAALMLLAALAAPAGAQERDGGEEEAGPAVPLHQRFRPLYEGLIYTAKVNFHQPQRGGHPAPYIDERGWHARDIRRPLLIRAGEQVMVTGVYDYGDRSLFLELTRWPVQPWDDTPIRVRVRVKAEAGPEEPEEQDEQIRLLVALFLGPPSP